MAKVTTPLLYEDITEALAHVRDMRAQFEYSPNAFTEHQLSCAERRLDWLLDKVPLPEPVLAY